MLLYVGGCAPWRGLYQPGRFVHKARNFYFFRRFRRAPIRAGAGLSRGDTAGKCMGWARCIWRDQNSRFVIASI